MRKYARKSAQVGLIAQPSALTTQIEADLVPDYSRTLHGHFAHWHPNWHRCKPLKMLEFSAALRLTSEQIDTCHFDLSL